MVETFLAMLFSLCYRQLILKTMKITGIKWNPHYEDRNFNGETLGRNFKCSYSKVTEVYTHHAKYDHANCREIIEENLTTYIVHYWDNTSVRIINPIEVELSS